MTYGKDSKLKQYVVYAIIQRFTDPEALAYLRTQGYDIPLRSFGRIKAVIKKQEFSRLSEIAKSGFVSQHLERIDQLELISKEMWKKYYTEKDPTKAVQILLALAQIQPYLSQYYEASKNVMEDSVKREVTNKPNTNNISEITK